MKKVSRVVAAMVLAGAGLVSGAPAASAHTTTVDMVLVDNGVWKAYASLNTSTGRLCVRAYHSVRGATAYVSLYQGGGVYGNALDRGGDTQNTCVQAYNYYHGQYAHMYLQYNSSTGNTIDALKGFTF